MRKVIQFVIVIVAMTMLAGCPMDPVVEPNTDTDSSLVGLWSGDFDELGAVTLTFADTTATFTAATVPSSNILVRGIFPESSENVEVTCDYEDTGNAITIRNCEGGNLLLFEGTNFDYTIKNNTLTFAILSSFTLTRQNTNAPAPEPTPEDEPPAKPEENTSLVGTWTTEAPLLGTVTLTFANDAAFTLTIGGVTTTCVYAVSGASLTISDCDGESLLEIEGSRAYILHENGSPLTFDISGLHLSFTRQ
ncbi:MAG: hypothetical protein ACR2PY_01825 [Salinispira sp.]